MSFSLAASWGFSFQSVLHLFGDVDFISKDEVGPGVMRSHRNPAFGSLIALTFGLSY